MMKGIRNRTCDVVIVGSGAGGATLARDLARAGKDVVIVEWGGDHPDGGARFASPFRYFGGFKNRKRAFMKTEEDHIAMIRCITTGGSTLVFGGVSWDPPAEMFKKYDIDLAPYVDQIKQDIQILPLPDAVVGPRARQIKAAAESLGYDWQPVERLFRNPSKCRPGDHSYFYGDRTGARWCARDWILEAVEHGATLMTNTYCEKIKIRNQTAAGIHVRGKNGEKFTIHAEKVVIAAGGIGSPVILRKSGIQEAGHSFFNDPYIVVYGHTDQKFTPDKEQSRQFCAFLEEDGISLADMTIPLPLYRKHAMMASRGMKGLSDKGVLSMLVEIVDDLGGTVDTDETISKPLSPHDRQKLEKGKAMAEKILRKAGATDIWSSGIGGVHPGGTCKIGDVVNANLETRFRNLYVADASVIPESVGIPPALTIMALAKRLAAQMTAATAEDQPKETAA